jgi:hypothetical protein
MTDETTEQAVETPEAVEPSDTIAEQAASDVAPETTTESESAGTTEEGDGTQDTHEPASVVVMDMVRALHLAHVARLLHYPPALAEASVAYQQAAGDAYDPAEDPLVSKSSTLVNNVRVELANELHESPVGHSKSLDAVREAASGDTGDGLDEYQQAQWDKAKTAPLSVADGVAKYEVPGSTYVAGVN